MSETVTSFRDGDNTKGELRTLQLNDNSILPQSCPSDQLGNPYTANNPLPTSVSGTVSASIMGSGPIGPYLSVSVVPSSAPSVPLAPFPVADQRIGELMEDILRELRLQRILFMQAFNLSEDPRSILNDPGLDTLN